MSANVSNHPILAVRLGVVDAAAWRNADDAGNPRGMSISLSKRFYDAKEEQWKNSRCYLAPHEVAAAIAVLSAIQKQLIDLDPTTAGNTEE